MERKFITFSSLAVVLVMIRSLALYLLLKPKPVDGFSDLWAVQTSRKQDSKQKLAIIFMFYIFWIIQWN